MRLVNIGELDAHREESPELIGIEAVFGSDLRDSMAVPAIAMHLRGLLSSDPRGYLRESLVEYV